MRAELVGIGFCVEPLTASYVPLNGDISRESVLKTVKPLFENPKIGFYGHNVKYDLHVLQNEGINVANICFDTILASYLLNAHNRQHSLDALTLHYFSKVKTPTSDLLGKGRAAITMDQVPIRKVCDYCCEDADFTCRLKELLEQQLKERKLITLFNDLELPLLRVLETMEHHGIFLDVPTLQEMGTKITASIKKLEHEIHTLAGESFNINSPKQVSDILFTKLGLSAPKKTATGFSTNADVLEELAGQHPIAEKLLEYRSLEKLRSTYIETLPEEVNPRTHRIHPTFNQVVAATGRLSCQNPNLQNIPTRTELGRDIRQAFRPEKKGWSYLAADYSQIELRLVAHFSEDPNLIKAFKHGEDIHAHTAATIFDVPLDKVTSDMRYRAKAVNFGIIYGQQAFGLARELGIGLKEAQHFIDTYFKQFPDIKKFLEKCKESTRTTGKAVTFMGRERAIPEINNKNPTIRNEAERLAINTPLQGSAADLIKAAMLKIDELFKKEGKLGYMILQIHDELIFELPDFELPTTQILVKEVMENVCKFKVPLVVNMKVGKNWKEC
jgi:DNA polymerase-1